MGYRSEYRANNTPFFTYINYKLRHKLNLLVVNLII